MEKPHGNVPLTGWYTYSTQLKTMWRPQFYLNNLGFGLDLPLWIPALGAVAALIAAYRFEASARWRQHRGHCASCGYDRSNIPGALPCPECATAGK